jgi:hypothetical protein
MHLFRQLATRYLQAWLGLWVVVVLAGILAPCCESMAATDPTAQAVPVHPGSIHDHDGQGHHIAGPHHQPAWSHHVACDADPAAAGNAVVDLLPSKNRFDPEPVKTLLVDRAIEPVSSPLSHVSVRVPAPPLLHYQSVYLATRRLRI